jgi:hypothetical protein
VNVTNKRYRNASKKDQKALTHLKTMLSVPRSVKQCSGSVHATGSCLTFHFLPVLNNGEKIYLKIKNKFIPVQVCIDKCVANTSKTW